MNRQAILRKFEEELRESHQNFQEGKGIPWEELDWGMPMYVAESKSEYRVQQET